MRRAFFGAVGAVGAVGTVVAAAAVLAGARPTPAQVLDPSLLEPGAWTYHLEFEGELLGTVRRVLEAGEEEGTMVLRSDASAPGSRATESVTFRVASFLPLAASTRLQAMGRESTGTLALSGGRLTGRVTGPHGGREIDEALPVGALLGDMAELAVWIADLGDGATFELRRVDLHEGRSVDVRYRVRGPVRVSVPAGTFDAWEVEVSRPGERRILSVRRDAPHVTLRIDVEGEPASLVLASSG